MRNAKSINSLRDVASLLTLCKAELGGLDKATSREVVEWLIRTGHLHAVDHRQLYQVCLDRLPESAAWFSKADKDIGSVAEHLVACLNCVEFAERAPEIISRNFAEKDRLFFIHVPKTAGTAVRQAFQARDRFALWDTSYSTADVSDDQRFSRVLGLLESLASGEAETIVISGHFGVNDLIRWRLLRPNDRAFSVIRDPMEVALSNLNYVLTVVSDYAIRADARRWTQNLSITDLPIQPHAVPVLAHKLLNNKDYFAEFNNVQSRALGGDSERSSALNALLIADVELVPVQNIREYLQTQWQITMPDGAPNQSDKFISSERELNWDTRSLIYERYIDKDVLLHDFLRRNTISGDGRTIIPSRDWI